MRHNQRHRFSLAPDERVAKGWADASADRKNKGTCKALCVFGYCVALRFDTLITSEVQDCVGNLSKPLLT